MTDKPDDLRPETDAADLANPSRRLVLGGLAAALGAASVEGTAQAAAPAAKAPSAPFRTPPCARKSTMSW
jgi:hypothetical protein